MAHNAVPIRRRPVSLRAPCSERAARGGTRLTRAPAATGLFASAAPWVQHLLATLSAAAEGEAVAAPPPPRQRGEGRGWERLGIEGGRASEQGRGRGESLTTGSSPEPLIVAPRKFSGRSLKPAPLCFSGFWCWRRSARSVPKGVQRGAGLADSDEKHVRAVNQVRGARKRTPLTNF